MYNKTKLSKKVLRGITNVFSSNIGLKQGCNLSPTLCNFFINDVHTIFDQTYCQPPSLLNLQLNYLLYADELMLISETFLGLQNYLNTL